MIDPKLQKIVEDLKAKHAGVKMSLLQHQGASIIVRHPTPAIYRKSKAYSRDEKTSADANEQLVRDCLLWPSKEELNAIMQDQPAITDTFASDLVKIAGGARGADEVVPL